MNLKQLFDDDRAVSPVIGVILMVAITVILAAVIGTFVLGLGDRVSTTTPSASLQFDYTQGTDNDTIEISHNGGDTVKASQLGVAVSGATPDDANHNYNWSDFGSSGDVKAGSTATINHTAANSVQGNTFGNTSLDLSGATVRVVWNAASGDQSAVLGKWNGPNA